MKKPVFIALSLYMRFQSAVRYCDRVTLTIDFTGVTIDFTNVTTADTIWTLREFLHNPVYNR